MEVVGATIGITRSYVREWTAPSVCDQDGYLDKYKYRENHNAAEPAAPCKNWNRQNAAHEQGPNQRVDDLNCAKCGVHRPCLGPLRPICQNGRCSERDKQSHVDQASRRGEAGELLTRRTSTKNDTDSEVGQLLKKERHDTHFRERRDVRFQAQRSREPASSQYDCNEKERRLAESGYGLSEPQLQPEHAHWSEQEANAKYDQENRMPLLQ